MEHKDPYIGRMLDNRYEILERIGTGGMAVVYKAKCHRLNRLVAIKILKADLAQDEDFRRRFNAESQAVAQLSHPNIVSVYDVSRGGDTEYIVMELIDGITLKQYMEKRGQLNWRESLHFITQIMRGLSHAHSRGIVHRDIKPQNVMVLRDGSVKVADFGIACLENAAQTLTQEALGSVHYISPEQARGDRIDARSDIYSAGVVLYEMLTGRLPFEGDSAVSVAIQHLSSIPLAPREINPDIPEQLELICMKAMTPDLEKRYPSADAMIADLEAFRKNPGVNLDFQMEDLRPEEPDEPTRLLRTGSYAAAAASSHASAREPVRERERRWEDYYYDEPAPRNSKQRTAIIAGAAVVAVVVIFLLFRTILGSFGSVDEYTVPDVTGMTQEEAEEFLEEQGLDTIFTLDYQGSEESKDVDAGDILRQSPESDKAVKKPDEELLTIKIWVSSGMEEDVMPDLVSSKNYSLASARLEMADLLKKYDIEIEEAGQEASDDVEAGMILSTDPAAGEPLEEGRNIQVIISSGKEKVKVPPFTNMPIDGVLSQLGTMGLERGDITEEESDKAKGTVLEQSIPADTEVDKGTKIDFVISSGPSTDEEGGSSSSGSQGTDSISVPLPSDQDSGRITVYMNGESVFDADLNFRDLNWTFFHTFYGSGTAEAEVYLNGEPYKTYSLDFGNG